MLNIDYSNETITPVTSFYDRHKGTLIINREAFLRYEKIIVNDENCRYPNLTIRILIHIFLEIENQNKWNIRPRIIAERLNANYDTVSKCLKYLRSIAGEDVAN